MCAWDESNNLMDCVYIDDFPEWFINYTGGARLRTECFKSVWLCVYTKNSLFRVSTMVVLPRPERKSHSSETIIIYRYTTAFFGITTSDFVYILYYYIDCPGVNSNRYEWSHIRNSRSFRGPSKFNVHFSNPKRVNESQKNQIIIINVMKI